MDDKWIKLIGAVVEAHPGPWSVYHGYNDRGGRYTTIADAKYVEVLDGETGHLSEPVFNLLVKFPELAEGLLGRPGSSGNDGESNA